MPLMKYTAALLLIWALPVTAQDPISSFILGESPATKDAPADAAAALPRPGSLSADWSRYLSVEPTLLQQRIGVLTRSLREETARLPATQQTAAKALTQRVVENLRALVDARKKTGPEPPAAFPFETSYTLQQWIALANERRTAQAELQSESENLARNEKRLNAARDHFEAITASYFTPSEPTRDRVADGLAVMAAWSELALRQERLRLQKATLALHQDQLDQLRDKSTAAREKLSIDRTELGRIKQELDLAERELAAARQSATKLALSATPADLDTDAGKAATQLAELQLRHGAIKQAIAEAAVIEKKMELGLAELSLSTDESLIAARRRQYRIDLDRIGEIDAQLDLWREEAEKEQGRAGQTLAVLFGAATRPPGELLSLAQRRLTEAQDTLLSLQQLDSELHDALLVSGPLQSLIAEREGAFRSGLETVKDSSVRVWERLWDHLQRGLFKIGETRLTAIGLLRVLLIISVAWMLSRFVRRGLTHLSERQRGSSAFLYTVGRLAHYLILILGISIGLSSIGVDLSNFALIAGALSLGMGFGLQAIVSNFVSGLIVLFEHSLRVGDFVELSSGVAGEVRAVNVRSTLVTTPDMVDILVPNSEFVSGKVINWTLTDASRRIHIPFGVAYGSDKDLVRKAGLEAAERTPYTLRDRRGREPQVWLNGFGDSSLDFSLVVWVLPGAVKKPQMVRAAYYWELETALRDHGIEIPFPQRDLHLRSGASTFRSALDPKAPEEPAAT